MIIPWIEGTLLLTQVAFLAVAALDINGTDSLVSLGEDEATFEQSITFRGAFLDYLAKRAVDNDVETCSRTANTQPRWWRLTLKSPLNISRILIIGGKDIRGQELQMDRVDVTIASDDQSTAVECKLSEFLVVEGHVAKKVKIPQWCSVMCLVKAPRSCLSNFGPIPKIVIETNLDSNEWHQFNCSQENATKIIHVADQRQSTNTELSLCEIKIFEKIVQPIALEQEPLIYEEGSLHSAAQETRSRKILLLGFLSCILLSTLSLL